jgi:hypothetical protein
LTAALAALPCAAYAADGAPTPEQLVALLRSGRERIQSLRSEQQTRGFRVDANGKRDSEPYIRADISLRWTPDRYKVREDRSEANIKGGVDTVVKTFAFSPKWSKAAIVAPGSDPLGRVAPGTALQRETDMELMKAIWSPVGDNWNDVNDQNSTVNRTVDGDFELSSHFDDGRTMIVRVDPRRAYLPTRYELRRQDGMVVMSSTAGEIREAAPGVWIPRKLRWELAGKFSFDITVTDAKANVELTDQDLDLRFPEGTYVHDEVAKIRYRVLPDGSAEMSNVAARQLPADELLAPSRLSATRPADDNELTRVAALAGIKQEGVVPAPRLKGPRARYVWMAGGAAAGLALLALWLLHIRQRAKAA